MQILKDMEFNRTQLFPELVSGKKCHTEVDSDRIQDIDRLIQFDAERICGVRFPGSCYENMCENRINPHNSRDLTSTESLP